MLSLVTHVWQLLMDVTKYMEYRGYGIRVVNLAKLLDADVLQSEISSSAFVNVRIKETGMNIVSFLCQNIKYHALLKQALDNPDCTPLLKVPNSYDQYSPLHYAVANYNSVAVELLLNHHSDILQDESMIMSTLDVFYTNVIALDHGAHTWRISSTSNILESFFKNPHVTCKHKFALIETAWKNLSYDLVKLIYNELTDQDKLACGQLCDRWSEIVQKCTEDTLKFTYSGTQDFGENGSYANIGTQKLTRRSLESKQAVTAKSLSNTATPPSNTGASVLSL